MTDFDGYRAPPQPLPRIMPFKEEPYRVFIAWPGEVLPAVRQTQRSKMVIDSKAREYNLWRRDTGEALVVLLRQEGIKPFPKQTRLYCNCAMFVSEVKGDGDNYQKALWDLLAGTVGLIPNDRWIREWQGEISDFADYKALGGTEEGPWWWAEVGVL